MTANTLQQFNKSHHTKDDHISVSDHFTSEKIYIGIIRLDCCPPKVSLAYMFTQSLKTEQLKAASQRNNIGSGVSTSILRSFGETSEMSGFRFQYFKFWSSLLR